MDNQVVVSDYAAMDRVLREERQYLLNIVKQIKKSGCNVLLVQKSILRSVTATAGWGWAETGSDNSDWLCFCPGGAAHAPTGFVPHRSSYPWISVYPGRPIVTAHNAYP